MAFNLVRQHCRFEALEDRRLLASPDDELNLLLDKATDALATAFAGAGTLPIIGPVLSDTRLLQDLTAQLKGDLRAKLLNPGPNIASDGLFNPTTFWVNAPLHASTYAFTTLALPNDLPIDVSPTSLGLSIDVYYNLKWQIFPTPAKVQLVDFPLTQSPQPGSTLATHNLAVEGFLAGHPQGNVQFLQQVVRPAATVAFVVDAPFSLLYANATLGGQPAFLRDHSYTELLAGNPIFTAGYFLGSANVNLGTFSVTVNPALPGAPPSYVLPQPQASLSGSAFFSFDVDVLPEDTPLPLGTSLNLEGRWTFNNERIYPAPPGFSALSVGDFQYLQFNHVTVDLGRAAGLIGTVLNAVQAATNAGAVHDLLAVLDTNLPLVDRKLRDVAQGLGLISGGVNDALSALDFINGLHITGQASFGVVDAGTFRIGHPRAYGNNVQALVDHIDVLEHFNGGPQISSFLHALFGVTLPNNSQNAQYGFRFWVLEDPEHYLFPVLLGQNQTLFSFYTPPLDFSVDFGVLQTLFGPLPLFSSVPHLSLVGSLHVHLQVGMGFDMAGFQRAAANRSHPDKDDQKFSIYFDRAHTSLSVTGGLALVGATGFDVGGIGAEAIASGGIFANVALAAAGYLDRNDANKLRLGFLLADPLKVVIANGSLSAQADARLVVHYPEGDGVAAHETLAHVDLLNFAVGRWGNHIATPGPESGAIHVVKSYVDESIFALNVLLNDDHLPIAGDITEAPSYDLAIEVVTDQGREDYLIAHFVRDAAGTPIYQGSYGVVNMVFVGGPVAALQKTIVVDNLDGTGTGGIVDAVILGGIQDDTLKYFGAGHAVIVGNAGKDQIRAAPVEGAGAASYLINDYLDVHIYLLPTIVPYPFSIGMLDEITLAASPVPPPPEPAPASKSAPAAGRFSAQDFDAVAIGSGNADFVIGGGGRTLYRGFSTNATIYAGGSDNAFELFRGGSASPAGYLDVGGGAASISIANAVGTVGNPFLSIDAVADASGTLLKASGLQVDLSVRGNVGLLDLAALGGDLHVGPLAGLVPLDLAVDHVGDSTGLHVALDSSDDVNNTLTLARIGDGNALQFTSSKNNPPIVELRNLGAADRLDIEQRGGGAVQIGDLWNVGAGSIRFDATHHPRGAQSISLATLASPSHAEVDVAPVVDGGYGIAQMGAPLLDFVGLVATDSLAVELTPPADAASANRVAIDASAFPAALHVHAAGSASALHDVALGQVGPQAIVSIDGGDSATTLTVADGWLADIRHDVTIDRVRLLIDNAHSTAADIVTVAAGVGASSTISGWTIPSGPGPALHLGSLWGEMTVWAGAGDRLALAGTPASISGATFYNGLNVRDELYTADWSVPLHAIGDFALLLGRRLLPDGTLIAAQHLTGLANVAVTFDFLTSSSGGTDLVLDGDLDAPTIAYAIAGALTTSPFFAAPFHNLDIRNVTLGLQVTVNGYRDQDEVLVKLPGGTVNADLAQTGPGIVTIDAASRLTGTNAASPESVTIAARQGPADLAPLATYDSRLHVFNTVNILGSMPQDSLSVSLPTTYAVATTDPVLTSSDVQLDASQLRGALSWTVADPDYAAINDYLAHNVFTGNTPSELVLAFSHAAFTLAKVHPELAVTIDGTAISESLLLEFVQHEIFGNVRTHHLPSATFGSPGSGIIPPLTQVAIGDWRWAGNPNYPLHYDLRYPTTGVQVGAGALADIQGNVGVHNARLAVDDHAGAAANILTLSATSLAGWTGAAGATHPVLVFDGLREAFDIAAAGGDRFDVERTPAEYREDSGSSIAQTTIQQAPGTPQPAAVYVMGKSLAPLFVTGNFDLMIGRRLNADGTIANVGRVDGLLNASYVNLPWFVGLIAELPNQPIFFDYTGPGQSQLLFDAYHDLIDHNEIAIDNVVYATASKPLATGFAQTDGVYAHPSYPGRGYVQLLDVAVVYGAQTEVSYRSPLWTGNAQAVGNYPVYRHMAINNPTSAPVHYLGHSESNNYDLIRIGAALGPVDVQGSGGGTIVEIDPAYSQPQSYTSGVTNKTVLAANPGDSLLDTVRADISISGASLKIVSDTPGGAPPPGGVPNIVLAGSQLVGVTGNGRAIRFSNLVNSTIDFATGLIAAPGTADRAGLLLQLPSHAVVSSLRIDDTPVGTDTQIVDAPGGQVGAVEVLGTAGTLLLGGNQVAGGLTPSSVSIGLGTLQNIAGPVFLQLSEAAHAITTIDDRNDPTGRQATLAYALPPGTDYLVDRGLTIRGPVFQFAGLAPSPIYLGQFYNTASAERPLRVFGSPASHFRLGHAAVTELFAGAGSTVDVAPDAGSTWTSSLDASFQPLTILGAAAVSVKWFDPQSLHYWNPTLLVSPPVTVAADPARPLAPTQLAVNGLGDGHIGDGELRVVNAGAGRHAANWHRASGDVARQLVYQSDVTTLLLDDSSLQAGISLRRPIVVFDTGAAGTLVKPGFDDSVSILGTGGPLRIEQSMGATIPVTIGQAGTMQNVHGAVDVAGNSLLFMPILLDDSADPAARTAVVGSTGANNLSVTGLAPAAVNVNGPFASVTLVGGSGDNTFRVTGGFDPNLTIRGAGGDELVGPDAANAWEINGAAGGKLNAQVSFAGMRTLRGGAGADVFVFKTGDAWGGNLDGGPAIDTLDYAAAHLMGDEALDLPHGIAPHVVGQAVNIEQVALVAFAPADQANDAGDTIAPLAVRTIGGIGPLGFAASGLPAGLAIDSLTGAIAGTIDAHATQVAPYQVVVSIADATGTKQVGFRWTVAPSFALVNPGDQRTPEGIPVALPIQVTNPRHLALTYSANGLPANLWIDPQTGVISGSIAFYAYYYGYSPTFSVDVFASDGVATVATHFTWATEPGFSFYSPGDQVSPAGSPAFVSLGLYNLYGHALSFAVSGLPPGVSFDASSAAIAGTLDNYADSGSPYHTLITIADATLDAADPLHAHCYPVAFQWTVLPAIVLARPVDQTSAQGADVTLPLSVVRQFGRPIGYAATGLPPGLAIDPLTGTISGTVGATPTVPFASLVTVSASDGIYSGSTSFFWNVQGRATNVIQLADVVHGGAITLTSPPGTTLSGAINSGGFYQSGDFFDFPLNGLSFEIAGVIAGAANVAILPPVAHNWTDYYVFGPTPQNADYHWYDFLYQHPTDQDDAGATGADFANGQIVLHLVDGGRGDDDLVANGTILQAFGGGPVVRQLTAHVTGLPATWSLGAPLSLGSEIAGQDAAGASIAWQAWVLTTLGQYLQVASGNQRAFTFTPQLPGYYYVTLTATGGSGNFAVADQQVLIVPELSSAAPPPAQLAVAGVPRDLVAGQSLVGVVVAQDAAGALVGSYNGSVSLDVNDIHGVSIAHVDGAFENGAFAIPPQALPDASDAPAELTVSIHSGALALSRPLTLHPAEQFGATSDDPIVVPVGTAFDFRIQTQDDRGVFVAAYQGLARLGYRDGAGFHDLGGGWHAVVDGVASFPSLSLPAVGAYALVAESQNGTLLGHFIITVPAATQFGLAGDPPAIFPGTPFDLVLAARDPSGNTVTGYAGAIVVSIDGNEGPVRFGPAFFTAGDLGQHRFRGLAVDSPGAHSVTVSDGVVTSTFSVNVGRLVTTTADDGPGSLRQAILAANAAGAGATAIRFDLGGPGPHVIALSAPWPTIDVSLAFDVPLAGQVEIGGDGSLCAAANVVLSKLGGGDLSIGVPQSYAAGDAWVAAAGTLIFGTDAGGAGERVLSIHAGATVRFASVQHLAELDVASGSHVDLAPGGNHVLVVDDLSIVGAGHFDLADNALLVHATANTKTALLAKITAKIASGANRLAWNGPGIASSAAQADPGQLTALGVMLNDNGLGGAYYDRFAGEAADANAILVKYTYYGDADLSGAVDGTDYALIDNGFNSGLFDWFNGDFDYSGAVDGTDYALIDNAFNSQTGPLASNGRMGLGPMPRAGQPAAGSAIHTSQDRAIVQLAPEPGGSSFLLDQEPQAAAAFLHPCADRLFNGRRQRLRK